MAEGLRVAFADLEAPAIHEGLRVTFADYEVPTVGAQNGLRVTFADMETPPYSARVQVKVPLATSTAAFLPPLAGQGVTVTGAGPMAATALGIGPKVTTGTIVLLAGEATAQFLVPSVHGVAGTIDGLRVTFADYEVPNLAARVIAPVAASGALALAPNVGAQTWITGAGPMTATALMFPPKTPNTLTQVTVGTAGASAPPPTVVGGAQVSTIVGTAPARMFVPGVSGNTTGLSASVNPPPATAVAQGYPPVALTTQATTVPSDGHKRMVITGPDFTLNIQE